jgi:hypothetical protein
MLVIKVLVNDKEIDEIGIINTGHRNLNGDSLYRIRKPEHLNQHEIYHDRQKPWHFLVVKVLEVINKDYIDKNLVTHEMGEDR